MTDVSTLQNIQYLGDGVYAGSDGYHVWLYTSDGRVARNFVALDPHVQATLITYLTKEIHDV